MKIKISIILIVICCLQVFNFSSTPTSQQFSPVVDERVALIANIAASIDQAGMLTSSLDVESLSVKVDSLASSTISGIETSTASSLNSFVGDSTGLLHVEKSEAQQILGATQVSAAYPFQSIAVSPHPIVLSLVRWDVCAEAPVASSFGNTR